LTGKHLVFLHDNDTPGLSFVEANSIKMQGKAASIKTILLTPDIPKGDIVDWVKTPGNDKQRFLELVQSAPELPASSPFRCAISHAINPLRVLNAPSLGCERV
jgi:hypothetical protein